MADTDKKEEMYWKVNIYGEETDELILSTVQREFISAQFFMICAEWKRFFAEDEIRFYC